MSRGLSTSFKNAAGAGGLYVALLAYFDFSGGVVRVWSGIGDLVWDAQTWSGLGDLGGVTPVQESNEPRANGVTFRLSGIPSAMVTRILSENYRGRNCKLYLALFDSLTATSPIADPALLFSGRMDQCLMDDQGETAEVTVTAESRLVDLQRPRERRYTDEDQKNLFPGDRGLEYVAGMQDKEIVWGSGSSSTSGINGTAGRAAAGGGGGGGGAGVQIADRNLL